MYAWIERRAKGVWTTAGSTQAHKRYSKMAKTNENILLPDFDVNYILNGFMRAYLPYFLAHVWKQNRYIHIFKSVDDNNELLVEITETHRRYDRAG